METVSIKQNKKKNLNILGANRLIGRNDYWGERLRGAGADQGRNVYWWRNDPDSRGIVGSKVAWRYVRRIFGSAFDNRVWGFTRALESETLIAFGRHRGARGCK